VEKVFEHLQHRTGTMLQRPKTFAAQLLFDDGLDQDFWSSYTIIPSNHRKS
jgi:hypothetical protein